METASPFRLEVQACDTRRALALVGAPPVSLG